MNSDSTDKPKKPRKLSVSQRIIIKHVARMEGNYNPADWGREGKLCSTLSKKYGADFLLWVGPPEGFKVSSLTFYFSVLGRNHLSDKLVEFKMLQPKAETKEISLSETKIGEDVQITAKPRTLKEFLAYGKTLATTGQQREEAANTAGTNGGVSGS